MADTFLLAECNIERELLIHLGFSFKTDIEKANGKADVMTRMKCNYRNRLAIGLVDEDPNKIKSKDYARFSRLFDPAYKMHFKKDPNANHFLIEFYDEFEPWILEINKKAKVEANRFLRETPTPRRLHEMNQSPKISNNYLKFYWEIVKQYPAPFNQIKEWIKRAQEGRL